MRSAKLEDVDDVTRAGEPLRRSQRHKTPVLVVVVKAGIENSRNTKPPRPRHQSEGGQSSLRACERHIIARRDLPIVGKLLSNQQRVNAVGVRGKVQVSSDYALQRFVTLSLPLGINAFRNHASRLPSEGEQHRLVDRWRDGTRSRCRGELCGHFLVVLDSPGAGSRERNMGCHAEQPVLQRLAETGVHGERDHQRRHTRHHSDDGKERDQTEDRGPVRRPQVPLCDKPFESHASW